MTCARKGCGVLAEFFPRVRVWATPDKDHGPAELLPELPHCRSCIADPAAAADILCPGFKVAVEEQLEARGFMPPLWGTVAVDFIPIPTATA